MIKICILYPNKTNARFDMGYYVNKHMPLSIKLLGAHPGFKGVSVERGVSGGLPGADAAYVAMCHFLFDSLENFAAAFAQHAAVLQADMPELHGLGADYSGQRSSHFSLGETEKWMSRVGILSVNV